MFTEILDVQLQKGKHIDVNLCIIKLKRGHCMKHLMKLGMRKLKISVPKVSASLDGKAGKIASSVKAVIW